MSEKLINYNLEEVNTSLSEDQINLLHKVIEVMENFGIQIKDKAYPCAFGSQYMLSVTHILDKPKEWWIALHQLAIALYEIYEDAISGIFEILWPPIFQHTMI